MLPFCFPRFRSSTTGRLASTGLALLALSACNRTPDVAPKGAEAPNQALEATAACGGKTQVLSTGGVSVYRMNNYPNVYFYTAGMQVDGDGSPYCYHPSNNAIALDYLGNATSESKRYVQGANGVPVIRGARGFYVSQTSLAYPDFPASDPRHWVDAESLPFVVIPGDLYAQSGNGIRPGNLAYAYNKRTGKGCFALCGDVGPRGKAGEASINLAQQLGVTNSSPKNGGQASDIEYVIIANSGARSARGLIDIYNEGVGWQIRGGGNDVLPCLGIRPASFPLLGITEADVTQEIRAGIATTFNITANPVVSRVKIIIDGQYTIYDAKLGLSSTSTVPFSTKFNQAGYRNLVIEGYDGAGTLLTSVSRRLRVL
ncbi:hypothetical protein IC235_17320 [Hymenobacter sp. BT664]|uniref:Uncharacterized protein n=1 Tax=Hymenobacter montanus TaxID=2771359 RepID=A0A927BGI6_9BACT|nr:glycoside hydrolase family 75 protein [Hymenobacter montanus]MBD2769653.1 hypothetical protein [Hymenobacter montanus]